MCPACNPPDCNINNTTSNYEANKGKGVRIGIDIGGVIIKKAQGGDEGDTSFFSENFLNTPPEGGAFDVIKRMVVQYPNLTHVTEWEREEKKRRESISEE